MDRKLLKSSFTKDKIPAWLCPTCRSGILNAKNNCFVYSETADSKKSRKHKEWEFEWVEYIYSMLLECSNKNCRDVVSSSGFGSVEGEWETDMEGYPGPTYYDQFTPKYFYPPLVLFQYPDEVEDDVKDELTQSFEIFFCNPSSSANHIRSALEKLLNHLKVKRFDTIKGRKKFIILHRRIEIISSKYPNLREHFLALKWLGNAGSHSHKKITTDDVLDAYEIFEFILNELFKSKSIKKLVKKINKKKGPINSNV
jgi:hypothetical protein